MPWRLPRDDSEAATSTAWEASGNWCCGMLSPCRFAASLPSRGSGESMAPGARWARVLCNRSTRGARKALPRGLEGMGNMDATAAAKPVTVRINRFLPYWAVFQADVRQTLSSWLYRLWVVLTVGAAAGYLVYRYGARQVAGIVTPA